MIKKYSLIEVENNLTEGQIREYMYDYGLTYDKAKDGLASYIHFMLNSDGTEQYEGKIMKSKIVRRGGKYE
ncbi:hypothetical protein FKF97_10285 [Clostridium perfringens]|nr:hypothetical protein [Clostridium perfringens]